MAELKPLKSVPPRPAPNVGGPPAKPDPALVKFTLTFTDGLNFGCGFFVAGALFAIFAVPAAGIALSFLTALLGRF